MAYYTSNNHRHQLISPYIPDRTEKIGDNTGQASAVDIGKPVKLDKDTVVPCAIQDEIYGFISAVEAGTRDGHSLGAVAADVGRDIVAVDEEGGLAVGDLVKAGTPVALGTAGVGNVRDAVVAPTIHKWQVVGIENDPSQIGDEVLLRKV